LILLRAITETKISLQSWIDDLGYETTPVSAVARPIRRPIYVGKYARNGNQDGPLYGETLVFTGSLHLPRSEAAALAAKAGCTIMDSVTKTTTILVVGDQDLRFTRGQEKSSKHRKAEALIEKGALIRIVGESDFMLMVN
jgi:DNA polymerase-3 subunit epsilon